MINKNFLILASLSTLLATTALSAGTNACPGGGTCMATPFSKPQSSRSFTVKKQEIEEKFQYNEGDNLFPIILDGQLINVFSSYELQDAKTFPLEDEIVIIEETQKIEDIILEQTDLPNSSYFCENHKTALFDKYVDIYECV